MRKSIMMLGIAAMNLTATGASGQAPQLRSTKACIVTTPTWQSVTAVPEDWVLENCQALVNPIDGGQSNTARAACILSTAGARDAQVIQLGKPMGLNWGLDVPPHQPRGQYFPTGNSCGWK